MGTKRSRHQRILPAILAACIAAASAAHAEDAVIYKWVDKYGVVTYSQNKPAAGEGQNVSAISVPTLPPEQQRAANRALLQMEKSADADYQAHKDRQRVADARVEAALKRLQQAEQRLTSGSQIQGGDRVGMVNGYSRLRGSYFDRVNQLETEVARARKELDAAYAARDQIQ